MNTTNTFPDGTVIDKWFYEVNIPKLETLGVRYELPRDLDDGKIHTSEIQALIDKAASMGGGVIVVPNKTILSGALYFKQGVNLYVSKGGVLKGSDNISDYPLCETRIEGETCLYFPALINADGVDGFIITGHGTIDGNGLRAWKSFWLRHTWNPQCTNKDEQRPRLIYLSNCKNVIISGLTLQNSAYWTTHIYKCSRVKYLNCTIFSPAKPVPAPSTDAIDVDVCSDVLIKGCYFEVNDDSVVLKGGKGSIANTLPENGSNERIIAEDCEYGFCHGCLTCGSESVHNRNIILRHSKVSNARNLLWLKIRPDTPQLYEYIAVDDVAGDVETFVNVTSWTQFFDSKGYNDIPCSRAEHIFIENCECECDTFFGMNASGKECILSDFIYNNLKIVEKNI